MKAEECYSHIRRLVKLQPYLSLDQVVDTVRTAHTDLPFDNFLMRYRRASRIYDEALAIATERQRSRNVLTSLIRFEMNMGAFSETQLRDSSLRSSDLPCESSLIQVSEHTAHAMRVDEFREEQVVLPSHGREISNMTKKELASKAGKTSRRFNSRTSAEGQLYKMCRSRVQEVLREINEEEEFALTGDEDSVVAAVIREFEAQSEIPGDGGPVRVGAELMQVLSPLVGAGRSVDLCGERNSLKALYCKGLIAKTTKDILKHLKLTRGFRGFLDWVGWKKSSAHVWINLYKEFGKHLLTMQAGVTQNKLEEIYKALKHKALDWTGEHEQEIAEAPNVGAVQKLLGTWKEPKPRASRKAAMDESQTESASSKIEQLTIGQYEAGFQVRADGQVTAFVDHLTVEDKNGLVDWLKNRVTPSKKSTAVDNSRETESPQTPVLEPSVDVHYTLDVPNVEDAPEPHNDADIVPGTPKIGQTHLRHQNM
jgi:hypothetical protein